MCCKTNLSSETVNKDVTSDITKNSIMDKEAVKDSCKKDSEFFRSMIDLIPPVFYFDKESKDKLKEKRERQEKDWSEKSEWKRSRYDPDHIKTVTEVQNELNNWDQMEPEKKKVKKKMQRIMDDDSSLKSATDSLEELRERLHNKLEALKAKRNSMKKDDWIEKKRLKRKMAKMKSKIKKNKPNMVKERDISDHANGIKSPNAKVVHGGSQKPIYNKEGKVVFSKFDFTEAKGRDNRNDVAKGKDYKRLLAKVQKKKEEVEQLKTTDQSKAKNLEEKSQWLTALQKAEGVKVKDNEELLKKALKRKEKKKKKTKQQWTERQDKVEKKIKDRQDKRKLNIQKKKQGRIDKKLKKAKKKGRVIPGF